MRTVLHHAIDIDAPPAAIWAVFCEFASWPRWFPYAVSARSLDGANPFRPGGRFEARLAPPGPLTLTLRFEVKECEPARRVRWIGRSLGVSGDHAYTFDDRGAWTRLTSHEEFGGPLGFTVAGPIRARIDHASHDSLARLKALVETPPR